MSERYPSSQPQGNNSGYRSESAGWAYANTQLYEQLAKAQASDDQTSSGDAREDLFSTLALKRDVNPGASGDFRDRRRIKRRAQLERDAAAAAKRSEQPSEVTDAVKASSADTLTVGAQQSVATPQASEFRFEPMVPPEYKLGSSDQDDWSVHTYDAQPHMDVNNTKNAASDADAASTAQDDRTFDTTSVIPSEEQDSVAVSGEEGTTPKKLKRVKKAKKDKPQRVSLESTPATYSDDQAFGPYESPATYKDKNEFMGPTKLGRPDRSQSRQVRELIASDAYKNARDLYNTTDEELAGKVARRLKLGMFTTKKTREAASADIETARPEYERMAETFDAIQIKKWKLGDPAISDEEINQKLAKFHEAKLRLQGLRAQNEIVTSTGKFGKLSEWNNTATEWYAGLSKSKKVGFALGGLAVGVVAGGFVATAGTVLGATAGVVGGGLLAGAKVYKTTMQGRAGLHRNTSEVNKADFKDANGKYKSIDDLRLQSSASFKKSLDQRVERADKVNKKTKWMTIASVALLGVGVADHIGVVHDVYKAVEGNVADYFGLTDHHGVIPSGGQGGGSGAPDHTAISPGNNVAPTHDVDHYAPKLPGPAPEPNHDILVPKDMGGATEFSGAGLDHFNQWANGHTVQPGESIWKLSQDYLQANGVKNPSVYQIDAIKDKVLAEFIAKGLADGNGWLQAGQQLITK